MQPSLTRSQQRTRNFPWIACLAGFGLALLSFGCGGPGDETSGKESEPLVCDQTTQQRHFEAKRRQLGPDQRFKVSLSAIKDHRGEAIVSVESARMLSSIGRGSQKFVPTEGAAFAAFAYSLKNVGSVPIEPAATLNEMFALQNGGNQVRHFLRADHDPTCGGVGDAYARSVGARFPQAAVEPGAKVKTVAVYVVPAEATELRWASTRTGDSVTVLGGSR